ncbi:acyltransferase [Bradyrhizobium sp.]|uniref:acyltransferase family protein n=1 Tax=Bradyrhizobium sp. TaxID=376 RepID=UPI001D544281|nr:acyltransferase [Bradyrhizobium sp.]MBI5320403.1 acyltransferase [Bradyrhizobium sp.]
MHEANRGKLIELEALRGVAAVVVMLHHFLVVVAPRLHGRNFPDDPIALVRTPLFALVNGTAAVSIFFVLSGFVLTLRAMERHDWRQLVTGALKRWPRLVPLVVTTNILSAAFVLLGLYQDRTWFGTGVFDPDTPVIRSALIDGLFTTFFHGSARFNTVLWTMHYELFGSFAAYATALILIFQRSFRLAMLTGATVLVLTAVCAGDGGVYYAMMVSGVLIARIYMERDTLAVALAFLHPWRTPIVLVTAALAIVLCGYEGYSRPTGFYAFMAPFASPEIEPVLHGIAAAAIVALALFCAPLRRQLARPTATLLGWLSFPLYLVHLPILLALIAPVHSRLDAHLGAAVAAPVAFLLFVALTLAAAYPLARFDAWWVRKLREMTSRVVTRMRAA